ncbi:aminotransferase class V-fold PLP-dependent enzyme [Burkholderia glumae]|uniref:Aminotransferase class V-fold PLP-dependent enzyme n=1 Tax=Burkholderia glumae TaxID=337 RepID=A0AAQ0BQD1_BURGL|nr:aminotransferase class V-fold PLP-dependent enzyme [Burkholderia glumae]ACR31567.1 class V aminotransferase [Burkholderia glumae BGR1]AJY64559.1 aminotransferase class-V family protein [Burkholderia glumae LMG 2196 = ATCC 33617]KHJ60772.1 aminotransferase V [Burkholderia glumae]MCM2485274.1 aminotransferase class V-fold PLP-dependent enzyme [Burkholderia glumae]MCM2510969.1 aminotransferase class V-fold PLP-dependent enzyme [Burkholderia glumae]
MADSSLSNGDDVSGWLMYHSVGVYPGQRAAVAEALARFTADWYAPDDRRWRIGLAARDALLSNWATLIGADPAQVFGAQNVTDVFARFLDGLDVAALAGRTVLVAADCFPSLHFLLRGVAARYGFALKTVPVRAGDAYVRDEDFIAAWSPDVGLALITWVSSLTSKRADLAALTAHARSRDSLVAVDITQGAGILPFDLGQTPVDFVCGSTLKWLCGAPGTGLGYLAPHRLAAGMQPPVRGWFSQPDPFNWDLDAFAYAPDARRFDTGTPSLLPFVASKPGFDWLLAQPPGTLRAHNLALGRQLIEIPEGRGYRLLSPRDDAARGGSIMVQTPAHLDPQQVVGILAAQRVLIDSRGRTLRLSPGAGTTIAGIERVAAHLPR